MPMIRLAKINRPDKYPEVAVVIATVSSFFIFYFMHGCVVLVRHYLDAVGIILDDHHQWMIKVLFFLSARSASSALRNDFSASASPF